MQITKVLILTTSFPIRKDSVSGLFVSRLVKNLPSNIKPLIITPWDNMEGDDFNAQFEIKCFKYAPRRFRTLAHSPGGIPVAIRKSKGMILVTPFLLTTMFLKCYKESKSVDLIHANWSVCGVIGGLVGCLRSIPVITTIRGEDGNLAEKKFVFRVLIKLAVKWSAVVVTVSESLVGKIKQITNVDDNSVVCIPNGIAQELSRGNVNLNTDKSKPLVLVSVASLTENKNISLVIHALEALIRAGKPVKYHLIGEGPQRPEIEKLIDELDLSDHVFIHGQQTPEEVYRFVREATIFVLSSFREGRPNVLLESMALGTPVVASDIEGVREILKHGRTGLLFDPNKVKELVTCLNKLGDDVKLQNIIMENAREYISSHQLYWHESAKRYANLYQQILSN